MTNLPHKSLGALVLSFFLASCGEFVVGSGEIRTYNIELEDISTGPDAFATFTAMEVEHTFDVVYATGNTSLTITCDENLYDYLDIRIRDGKLTLGLVDNLEVRRATLKAAIKGGTLDSLTLSGASQAEMRQNTLDQEVDIAVSGASKLTGFVQTENLKLQVSGASALDISGSIGSLEADISGASKLEAKGVAIEDADIVISGASDAALAVTGTLAYNLSGVSRLTNYGDAQIVEAVATGGSRFEVR